MLSEPTNSQSPDPTKVTAAEPTVDSIGQRGEALPKEPDNESAPRINLLGHEEPAAEVPPLAASAHVSAAPASKHVNRIAVVGVIVAVLALTGAGLFLVFRKNSQPQPKAQTSPTPVVTPTPTPAPSPPSTAPPLPDAPTTVSVPAVAPTSDHPQTVTVQSKSGLWLRSTPDSSSRANIIGWIPNNAQVSVDKIGDFWWHGTYKGQAGYFASKYTQ